MQVCGLRSPEPRPARWAPSPLTRFLSGLLFGVSSLDAATFLVMAAVLAAVTLLACYIPARRASRAERSPGRTLY